VVLARHGHPAVGDKLDLDTYLAERHIQVSSRRYGPSLIDIELSRRGLRRQVFLRTQHNLTACMVVSKTDMLLTLPERHAQLLNRGGSNRVYPFPLAVPRLEAHLYWHESVENDPANRWLREEIERVLAAESPASAPPPKTVSRRRRDRPELRKRKPARSPARGRTRLS
jgi:DNA-binding transcriptional LysR family regulator